MYRKVRRPDGNFPPSHLISPHRAEVSPDMGSHRGAAGGDLLRIGRGRALRSPGHEAAAAQ